MPQCSWAPGLSFLPVSSALVTFRSLDGKSRVHSVGWLGVVCDNPPRLSVCFRSGTDKRELPRAGDLFFVNLPYEEILRSLAGWRWQEQEAGLTTSARPPLSIIVGEGTGAPLLSACPVQIECLYLSLNTRFGQHRLCGEVVAVHLEGRRHELTAPVDFCRLAPFQRRRFQGRGAALEQRVLS